MIVRTILAASLFLASAATAQTFRPASTFPNAPPCPAGASCATAPVACSGHGAALPGRCNCFPGWTGLSCETPTPFPMACNGHGDMVQGRCVCTTFWMGAECSVAGLSITGRAFRQ